MYMLTPWGGGGYSSSSAPAAPHTHTHVNRRCFHFSYFDPFSFGASSLRDGCNLSPVACAHKVPSNLSTCAPTLFCFEVQREPNRCCWVEPQKSVLKAQTFASWCPAALSLLQGYWPGLGSISHPSRACETPSPCRAPDETMEEIPHSITRLQMVSYLIWA